MRRIDAEELVLGSAKTRKAVESKKAANAEAVCLSSLTISNQNADNFESQKALLDVYFLCDLISNIFDSHPDKPKIKVQQNGKKPSKKLLNSSNVLLELIKEARKVENQNRINHNKAPLTKLQEILSLLGVNPDNLGKHGFSLMERLAISYAKRNGIDCVDEAQLKWFAENARTEPKLLGSFLLDVQRQAAKLLANKKSNRADTKIYEVDSEKESKRL